MKILPNETEETFVARCSLALISKGEFAATDRLEAIQACEDYYNAVTNETAIAKGVLSGKSAIC